VRKSGFLMILFLSPLVFTIPIAHCNESDEVQEWIAELKDEDPRIRQTAAEILGRLKDPRAIGPLILALVDEASEVREAAFEALKNFLFWEKSDAARSLVPKLIEALRDENPWARFIAAWSLGEIKDPRAVEPLIATLKDKDFRVRWNAAKALGEIGDPKAVKPLIAALKDEDSWVRWRAAEALGEIKDSKALEPLIEALKDENSGVCSSAAFALGKIQDPKAVEPLIEALKDKDSWVRWNAAEALGKIKDPRVVEPLIEALKDEDSGVRWRAAKALGKIKDPRAVEPLIEALKDPLSRDYVAKALEEITGEKLGRNFWKWREWFEKKTAASAPTTSRVEFEGKGVPYVCGGGCWNGGRDRFGGLNEISIENGRPGKSVRIFPVRGTLPQKLRVVLEGRRWWVDLGDHIDYAALGLERGDNSWSKTPQTIIEGTLTLGGSLTQNGYKLAYAGGEFRISLADDYSEAFKAVPWKGVVLRVYDEAGVEIGKYSFRETRIGSDPSSPLEAGGIFPRVESAFGQCVWWALWRKWEEEWKPDSSKVIKVGSGFYPPPGGKPIEKGWRPLPHDIIVLHRGPDDGHYAFVERVDDEEYRSGAKPYIKLSVSEFNLATDSGGYTQTYSASTVYWWPDGEEVRFTRNTQPPYRDYPWTKKTNEKWEWYYVGPEHSPVGTGPVHNPRVL